jgi:hypothetical protein
MHEHDIPACIAELMLELRFCGCYCRPRDGTFPAYVCHRHQQLAELPTLAVPDHLLTIAFRNSR